MDRNTNSGGHGHKPPNQGSSGEQRSSSQLGSIPRRTLPPTQPSRLVPSQGQGHLHPPPPAAGYQPPPGQQYSQQQQQQQQQPHGSSLNAPIPRKHPVVQPMANAPIPRKSLPSNDSIPRKQYHPASPKAPQEAARPVRKVNVPRVSIKSNKPLILTIKAKGVPLDQGIPSVRSSARMPKRKRPIYEELRDTDSDDFLTDSDDEEYGNKTRGGRLHKKRASPTDEFTSSIDDVVMTDIVTGPDATDTPPPGTLASLWYSREEFLNTAVLEKVIGWKSRPVVKLEWHDENDIKMLDLIEAKAISTKLLLNGEFWNNRMKRMEVSRINASQCPLVLVTAAAKESTKENPRYSLAPRKEDEREEVLLVKWRGRSYMHCSWERKRDLEKFDVSNNTARNKIRRYLQSQEIAMGKNWRQVIENDRASNADATAEDGADEIEENEFFPPQYLEVERILGCDENDIDMKVLAKQRALNLRADQAALRKREEDEAKMDEAAKAEDVIHHTHKSNRLFENLPKVSEGEDPWDPEDYVRYVVKWKGLQYSEMTWEFWKDIKSDAVDEAEDFWYRQRVPSMEEVNRITSRPHPHVRDFRKLAASPEFAISQKPRPIADLGDGISAGELKDDEDDKESQGFKLRGYQLEGVNWLLFNWFNKRSCILADEMGLGKTIQSIGFLHQLHEMPITQVRGPFLIVAPLSLIAQWQSETNTWAPDMNVVFYHGSAEARAFLVQQEFYYTDQFVPQATAAKLKKKHITKFDILITTYEVVLKDVDVLSKIRWKALIVDEAHRLKNTKARLFEELATVPRDFCILLTGTPLQNSTEELWALLNFSDPVTFGDKDAFVEKFGELKDAKQVSELHTVLKPYLLRRVKEDVEKSLPPKEETILEVTLTPIQKKYYKAIYEKNTSFLFKGAKPSNAPSLMNIMMELRKCCNHPFLIRGAEDRILHDAADTLKGRKDESGNDIPLDYLKLFGDELVNSSGKMVLLSKLLPKLYAGGHKVLIFSQMVRCLDLLEEFMKMQHYKYERLDGSTTASARTAAVDRFHRKRCERFVMLLSTRAGGLGLNLTAADVVIIFDSDWNPQNDLQAMARAHRIGQTRAVSVYRLLTAKTYEMHMFHAASMKLGLDRAVLAHQRQQETEDSEEAKSKSKSEREVQAKEIDELLKKGAYDVFRDDDDTEAKQFLESDIDQLLERSSKKVTYGNVNASSMSSGLGSFSKASFVANTGEGGDKDVDLDDPNFWEKAVGLQHVEETPEEISQMIDDGVKRSRKQVQVFDPYAPFQEAEEKKKNKMEQRLKAEKEEKDRLKSQKKKKRREEKERKKREKQEARGRLFSSLSQSDDDDNEDEDGEQSKGSKSKKARRAERRSAQRRAENEDPLMERLKQAWEAPQRNRASSAALRFGFARFCKLRSESHLTSLPIHDLEVFFRSYVYQLSLQVAVTLLSVLRSQPDEKVHALEKIQVRHLLCQWLGQPRTNELEWICSSIHSVIKMQIEVENQRRSLRLPLSLAEPSYVADLRQGAALRALRRIGLLNRLNAIVEDALDEIFTDLGHEELGKRGCSTKDLSSLDADLKARHVTTEELALALSSRLGFNYPTDYGPSMWWDRNCDVALLVGSFIHGFGNYEAMRNDDDLPFKHKIQQQAMTSEACAVAHCSFVAAAKAAREVFDDALESAKSKAQQEVNAAVAAATSSKVEDNEMSSIPNAILSDIALSNDIHTDDTHLVTLVRLSESVTGAARESSSKFFIADDCMELAESSKIGDVNVKEEHDDDSDTRDLPLHKHLPMPDARILDDILIRLVGQIDGDEALQGNDLANGSGLQWEMGEDASIHEKVRASALEYFLGLSKDEVVEERRSFDGIGFSGAQCATTHRSLDDGSDYSFGSASQCLSQVATGVDAPRYLRALGVPMNLTRYAVCALVYADSSVRNAMLKDEQNRSESEGDVQPATTSGDNAAMADDPDPPTAVDAVPSQGSGYPNSTVNPSLRANGDTSKYRIPHAVPQIPDPFQNDAPIRAGLCAAALHCGLPSKKDNNAIVDAAFLQEMSKQLPMMAFNSHKLFSFDNLSSKASSILSGVQCPSTNATQQYLESVLLPHCLRLCVMGNGPSTRNARASNGKFETAYGISYYPDCSKGQQSPLPDPCAPLANHSVEALSCAFAILRRARLLRAAQHIVSGGVPLPLLMERLKSSAVRDSVDDLPVWWSPEAHDLGLLLHAATHGLFSMLVNRKSGVFAVDVIKHHIRTRFMAECTLADPFLNVSQDEVSAWVEDQAQTFPSANTLERRLGLLCSVATAHLGDVHRYDYLPMWDHGSWPRK